MPKRLLALALLALTQACELSDLDNEVDGETVDEDAVPDLDDLDLVALPTCSQLKLQVNYDQAARLNGGQLIVQEARTTGVQTIGTTPSLRVQSDLLYSDPQVYGGPRAETEASGSGAFRYRAGQTGYYGFRVYIPADWIDDGGYTDIIFQWKNSADASLGEASKSPDMFVMVKGDQLMLRITYDANRVSTATSPTKLVFPIAPLTRGAWNDIVVRAVWSYGSTGDTKLWHKLSAQSAYTLVIDQPGPNMHNDIADGYLKWGIYKPDWKNGPTAVSRRTVQHDNIRAGSTFEAVRPDYASCQ